MKTLYFFSLLSLCASLLLAAPSKKETELNKVIKMGQHSSKLLLTTLGKQMKKHMKDAGPMKALDFCSSKAYDLTESVNKKLPVGVRVKRISTKYRNPINKPSQEELAVLESFEKMKEANVILPKQLVQETQNHLYKYYKPLVIEKKVCLKCHGDKIDIELKKEIAKRYPLDKARNYKLHDLRGAIVVEIDRRKK